MNKVVYINDLFDAYSVTITGFIFFSKLIEPNIINLRID